MLCIGYASAQQLGKVGINTDQPAASLDIRPSADNAQENATTNEGLLIPRISKVRASNMNGPEISTLIYINSIDNYTGSDARVSDIDAEGFYYFDGNKWKALKSLSGSQGPKGEAGNRVWPRTTDPDNSIGKDGDLAVNATSGDVFEKKANAWQNIGNLRGPAGAAGPIGPRGEMGQQGPKGESGSRIWPITRSPLDNVGAEGDIAVNSANGEVYEKRASTWVSIGNIRGPKGETGNRIWPVTSQPLDTYGTNGDMAVDASSGNIYEKKNNTWENIGNIKASGNLTGNIGINQENPITTLDIHKAPTGNTPAGVIFPRLSTAERDTYTITEAHKGLMIFNTTKNCIDWWNGTQWSCIDGSYAEIPVPKTGRVGAFPDIELGNSAHWISSIHDTDYLTIQGGRVSIESPKGPASLQQQRADGIASGPRFEDPLDVQGKIPTEQDAIITYIPLKVKQEGRILKFKTYAGISGQYTKDGKSGIVILEWLPANLTTDHKSMMVKVYAQDKEIELKQLDLVAGQGEDQMGILMTSFRYPKIQAESQQPQSNWTGTYDLRLISAIPDNKFTTANTADGTVSYYMHRFVYVPVMGPDGNIWFNNNLGANYADTGKPSTFDPNQQAKSNTDYNAYGFLGQWGREYNGHEIVYWTSGTQGRPAYEFKSWTTAVGSPEVTNYYENCPKGWHTPTKIEFDNFLEFNNNRVGRLGLVGNTSNLRIPYAGRRSFTNGANFQDVGTKSLVWSVSSFTTEHIKSNKYVLSDGNSYINYDPYTGLTTRCIKDGSTTSLSTPAPQPPTPQPPTTSDYTATIVWGDDKNEKINVDRNDCRYQKCWNSPGIDYPTRPEDYITYTATSSISQQDANWKAIQKMDADAARRRQIAQEYANRNLSCPTKEPICLPEPPRGGGGTVSSK